MTDTTRDDARAERLYRWTIRGLYAFALAANVWLLIDTMKDTPEGQLLLHRMEERWEKIMEPARRTRDERLQANRVILEAMMIVDDAKGTDG